MSNFCEDMIDIKVKATRKMKSHIVDELEGRYLYQRMQEPHAELRFDNMDDGNLTISRRDISYEIKPISTNDVLIREYLDGSDSYTMIRIIGKRAGYYSVNTKVTNTEREVYGSILGTGFDPNKSYMGISKRTEEDICFIGDMGRLLVSQSDEQTTKYVESDEYKEEKDNKMDESIESQNRQISKLGLKRRCKK